MKQDRESQNVVDLMRLSIGQISQVFSLSSEALRYYEKKGLISPYRNPENNYRYYDFTTIQRISCLKRMQNQSFTLDEIAPILSRSSTTDLLTLYKDKHEQAHQELAYRKRMLRFTQEQVACLEALQQPGYAPEVVDIHPYYAWVFSAVEEFWAQALCTPLLAKLLEHMPLTSFSTFIGREHLKTPCPKFSRGLALSAQDARLIGVREEQAEIVLPAGQALHYLLWVIDGETDVKALTAPCLEYLAAHARQPGRGLFTRQLVCRMGKDGKFQHLVSVYLPLENP